MSFFYNLYEQLLNESLDDIYSRYYQGQVDWDDFNDIISLDPTFNRDQDRLGVYGKWLLLLNSRGNLPTNEQQKQELKVQLEIFDRSKPGYDAADRDIGRIHNLQELMALNAKYDTSEDTSTEYLKLSRHEGVTGLGQSANWEVYKLDTYEGSRYVRGDNACWCTGRANTQHYWDSYNSRSYLIVFINKHDRDDKYQGAFNKNDLRCTEFNDARNRGQNFVTFLSANEDIQDILNHSDYRGIVQNIIRQIESNRHVFEKTDHMLSSITNKTLVITPERAEEILNFDIEPAKIRSLLESKELEFIAFEEGVDIIKTLICVLSDRECYLNNGGRVPLEIKNTQYRDIFKDIKIIMPEISELSISEPGDTEVYDEMFQLLKYHPEALYLHKATSIVCKRWMFPRLKKFIRWID